MSEIENEGDLFVTRKFQDEDPLRFWFYSEIVLRMFLNSLKEYFDEIGFDYYAS